MIIGINGKARSGKDTVADYLVRDHGFVKVAFADPLKRICKEVFDFSDDQLWGDRKEDPDPRYYKPCYPCCQRGRVVIPVGEGYISSMGTWVGQTEEQECRYCLGAKRIFLTPRHALQQLGTEWARACYEGVWVKYALRVAKSLLDYKEGGCDVPAYSRERGLFSWWQHKGKEGQGRPPISGVVISDVRFRNEIDGLRAAGGLLWRIKRPIEARLLAGSEGPAEVQMTEEEWRLRGNHIALSDHMSETEQDSFPDDLFECTLINDSTLEVLRDNVAVHMGADLPSEK